ncbi:MAG: SulP family inorganic anion transporter [Flavobacteriales bacterium]
MSKFLSAANIVKDIPASIVVFLVALPLCLGIASASEAPVISGLIAGVIGGIVVGSISNSNVSVSGPAAGLTTIVLASISELGAFDIFLISVFIAGLLQIVFGLLRLGFLAQFVPNSVIKGMLAAIGIILILKQIPHAVGYDRDFEGDFAFEQPDKHNTLSELWYMLDFVSYGAIIIAVLSLAILLIWELKALKKYLFFQVIPGALIVVLLGIGLNEYFHLYMPQFYLDITGKHVVDVPVFSAPLDFFTGLTMPAFSNIGNPQVWIIAVELALVATLESLLSIEATDKIDPYNRITSPNRELLAQGTGNAVSGLLGGIPVTAVIVRSSANINAGARSKLSAILHGVFLLLSVLFLTPFLNRIPFASLAAVLLMVGYKLTKPSLFVNEYKRGWNSIIPFVVTIVAILFTDLLKGICIGLLTGLFFVIRSNYQHAVEASRAGKNTIIRFNKDIFFTHKARIKRELLQVSDGGELLLNAEKISFIDKDVLELLREFAESCPGRGIQVRYQGAALESLKDTEN